MTDGEISPSETQPHEAPQREVDPHLLESLVCPATQGLLEYDRARHELISRKARLAFPVRDGVPIMLIHEARTLSDER